MPGAGAKVKKDDKIGEVGSNKVQDAQALKAALGEPHRTRPGANGSMQWVYFVGQRDHYPYLVATVLKGTELWAYRPWPFSFEVTAGHVTSIRISEP